MIEYPSMFSTPALAPGVRARVIRLAGAVYGLVFALGFAVTMWGIDAVLLWQASFNLAWAKFVLGLLLAAPIAALAGWLATLSRWTIAGILVWIVAGPLLALLAGHLPYEGLSLLAQLGDPYPTGRMAYPFLPPAAVFTGFSMVMGAGFGLMTGLVQIFAVERAWNNSTAEHRLGLRSILSLGLCLPLALVFGALADFQINASTREPIRNVASAIDTALDPAADLRAARVPFLESRRDRMSPAYTTYLVQYSDSLDTATVDVLFDTGMLLRCQHGYGVVFFCSNLEGQLHEWMTELVSLGDIVCANCPVNIDVDALSVLSAARSDLGRLRDVTLFLHRGGWLYERAEFDGGRSIECRFRGNRPIVIDMCAGVVN